MVTPTIINSAALQGGTEPHTKIHSELLQDLVNFFTMT
jgi:hypothetical protein